MYIIFTVPKCCARFWKKSLQILSTSIKCGGSQVPFGRFHHNCCQDVLSRPVMIMSLLVRMVSYVVLLAEWRCADNGPYAVINWSALGCRQAFLGLRLQMPLRSTE